MSLQGEPGEDCDHCGLMSPAKSEQNPIGQHEGQLQPKPDLIKTGLGDFEVVLVTRSI